jgi:peptide/nickel transport system permease protein
MSDRRLAWGLGFIAALAVLALAAPWLGLRDPDAQPDGLVLRDLPPLSRATAIALADGTLRYAHEVSALPDGGVSYRRGERWTTIPESDLPGPTPAEWHRRPFFLLGTDGFGRDLASRMIHGARIALAVGLLSALVALVLGGAIGLIAGFMGGWVDGVLMRFADLLLSIPRLFLLLFLVALYRPSLTTVIVVLGATSWMIPARLVRGEVLSLREREYIQAARSAGAPSWRVALVHLLPGALAPLIVEGVLRVANTILLEATLSFLGRGVPPPTASWGSIIADGSDRLLDAWWIATLPGVAIAVTVVTLGLVGDALRDRLDPTGTAS